MHETSKPSENKYETPAIIHEGELEVQAGSPAGLPLFGDETALE